MYSLFNFHRKRVPLVAVHYNFHLAGEWVWRLFWIFYVLIVHHTHISYFIFEVNELYVLLFDKIPCNWLKCDLKPFIIPSLNLDSYFHLSMPSWEVFFSLICSSLSWNLWIERCKPCKGKVWQSIATSYSLTVFNNQTWNTVKIWPKTGNVRYKKYMKGCLCAICYKLLPLAYMGGVICL